MSVFYSSTALPTTTTLKSSSGIVERVLMSPTSPTPGSITMYNGTTVFGPTLCAITSTAGGVDQTLDIDLQMPFTTALTVTCQGQMTIIYF